MGPRGIPYSKTIVKSLVEHIARNILYKLGAQKPRNPVSLGRGERPLSAADPFSKGWIRIPNERCPGNLSLGSFNCQRGGEGDRGHTTEPEYTLRDPKVPNYLEIGTGELPKLGASTFMAARLHKRHANVKRKEKNNALLPASRIPFNQRTVAR